MQNILNDYMALRRWYEEPTYFRIWIVGWEHKQTLNRPLMILQALKHAAYNWYYLADAVNAPNLFAKAWIDNLLV